MTTPIPGWFRVVLVPAEQTTEDGCKAGFVKLTGTPGEGSWDEWGPYQCVGALSPELVQQAFGVPAPVTSSSAVPSAS